MALSHHNPLRNALSLRHAMDQLLEESFVRPRWLGEGETGVAPMDVYEDEQGYHVRVALPGVKPEDIELTVDQNTVTIKGMYRLTHEPAQQQGQGARENWLMHEMQSGAFQRSITFDRPIDVENIRTTYENGILEVAVPISQTSRPRRIQVNSSPQASQQISADTGQMNAAKGQMTSPQQTNTQGGQMSSGS
jgi:HSP20 family protein